MHHWPEAIEHARAHAYPGREQAEINATLRLLRSLLDRDQKRSRPPITLARLRER
jgi:hypothetical protein